MTGLFYFPLSTSPLFSQHFLMGSVEEGSGSIFLCSAQMLARRFYSTLTLAAKYTQMDTQRRMDTQNGLFGSPGTPWMNVSALSNTHTHVQRNTDYFFCEQAAFRHYYFIPLLFLQPSFVSLHETRVHRHVFNYYWAERTQMEEVSEGRLWRRSGVGDVGSVF